jgi:indolepyruvate ferredoxin oxidoreductase, beta subunit
LRYINWVKPDGKILLNNHTIFPPSVSLGKMEYPKDVEQTFRNYFKENVWIVSGSEIAKRLGSIQVANVVLIGAFSNYFPELAAEQWTDAIKALLPSGLHEINLKAFQEGRSAITI